MKGFLLSPVEFIADGVEARPETNGLFETPRSAPKN